MEPSLVLVDASSGALIEKHVLPAALSQLSTRHVDLDASGGIWFACQYEGPRNDLPPLVGRFAKGEALRFVEMPGEIALSLANYVGAIAVNRRDGLIGLTSPKGGTTVTLDAATGKVIGKEAIRDAAGIAAGNSRFAVSSYDGEFNGKRSDVAWDQHIVRLKGW
jgi:uncharacterized protein